MTVQLTPLLQRAAIHTTTALWNILHPATGVCSSPTCMDSHGTWAQVGTLGYLWLGYLLSKNETTLEEIALAAERADRLVRQGAQRCGNCGNEHVDDTSVPLSMNCVSFSMFVNSLAGNQDVLRALRIARFDFDALISALVIEAIAKGVRCNTCEALFGSDGSPCIHTSIPKWTDTHAPFVIERGCQFIVPALRINTEVV